MNTVGMHSPAQINLSINVTVYKAMKTAQQLRVCTAFRAPVWSLSSGSMRSDTPLLDSAGTCTSHMHTPTQTMYRIKSKMNIGAGAGAGAGVGAGEMAWRLRTIAALAEDLVQFPAPH